MHLHFHAQSIHAHNTCENPNNPPLSRPYMRNRSCSMHMCFSVKHVIRSPVDEEVALIWGRDGGDGEGVNVLFQGSDGHGYQLKSDIFDQDLLMDLSKMPRFIMSSTVLLHRLLSEAIRWCKGEDDEENGVVADDEPYQTCVNGAIMTVYLEELCKLEDVSLIGIPRLHSLKLEDIRLSLKCEKDPNPSRKREALGLLGVSVLLNIKESKDLNLYSALYERLSVALEAAVEAYPHHFKGSTPIENVFSTFKSSLTESDREQYRLAANTSSSATNDIFISVCAAAHSVISDCAGLGKLNPTEKLVNLKTAIPCALMLITNYERLVEKKSLTVQQFHFVVSAKMEKASWTAAIKTAGRHVKDKSIPINRGTIAEVLSMVLMEIVVNLRMDSESKTAVTRKVSAVGKTSNGVVETNVTLAEKANNNGNDSEDSETISESDENVEEKERVDKDSVQKRGKKRKRFSPPTFLPYDPKTDENDDDLEGARKKPKMGLHANVLPQDENAMNNDGDHITTGLLSQNPSSSTTTTKPLPY